MHKATVLVQYSCSIRINCFPKQLSTKQFRSQFFLPRRKLFQVGLADHLTNRNQLQTSSTENYHRLQLGGRGGLGGGGGGCLKRFIPKEHDLTLRFHFKCESYSSMFKFIPDFPRTSSSAYFAVQSWNISTSPFIGCTAPFINGLSKNST